MMRRHTNLSARQSRSETLVSAARFSPSIPSDASAGKGRKSCAHVLFLVALLSGVEGIAEYGPNLRWDPEVDRIVYGLAARHGVPLPCSWYLQPMAATDLRRYVALFDSLGQAGALTRRDLWDLTCLRRLSRGDQALLSWAADSATLEAHVHLQLTGQADPSRNYSRNRDSLFASGLLGAGLTAALRRVSIYGAVEVATDYRSVPFTGTNWQPYNGVGYTMYGQADTSNWRAIDMVWGGIQYEGTRFRIQAAMDQCRAGPAVHNPLLLSAETPPFAHCRARLDLELIEYSHMFGLLRSQKDKPKYIYLQRIDIPYRPALLHAGITQMVITGSTTDQLIDTLRPVNREPIEREFEWLYLLPFVPFSFTEHYLGDRDNSVLSVDLQLTWPRGFRWYGEVLIDDITAPWSIFGDEWNNKWAAVGGAEWHGELRGRNVAVSVEYAHIEPWVYTHVRGPSHDFTHFGDCIGSSLGPNADALHFGVRLALSKRNTLGLTFANERKGATRGSSIHHAFQFDNPLDSSYNDRWTKTFLGPGTTRSTRIGVLYSYSPLGRFRIQTGLEVDVGDHKRALGTFRGGWVW